MKKLIIGILLSLSYFTYSQSNTYIIESKVVHVCDVVDDELENCESYEVDHTIEINYKNATLQIKNKDKIENFTILNVQNEDDMILLHIVSGESRLTIGVFDEVIILRYDTYTVMYDVYQWKKIKTI